MKAVLVILLLLHGAIHIIGFLKGFQLAKVSQLTETISKPMGLIWLLITLLFLLALIGLVLHKEFWTTIALVAIVGSQILIVLHWKDAAFGTIANIMLLFLVLPIFGKQQFDKQITHEKNELINSFNSSTQEILKRDEILNLPVSVQNWLLQSGAVERPKAFSARLKQTGRLKTKPDSNWMSFKAEQYFDVNSPAFIWTTTVDAFPGVNMSGRDRLENGTGEMLIKLASLIPVVNEKGTNAMNSGAMIRFLGEICWFPSAAVKEYITWEEIDRLSAKATFLFNNQSVSGVFRFTENGEIKSFEAQRYFGGAKDAQIYPWKIEVKSYKIFEGIKVPAVCHVIWKLPDGDFEWLQLEISHMEQNTDQLFEN